MNFNLKESEKNIIAALCVVLVISIFLIWTKPALDQQKSLANQIKALKKELKHPKYTEEDLNILNNKINTLEQETKNLKGQLPLTEKRDFLIKDLEAMARAHSIELINFTPKDAVPLTMSGQEITAKMRKFLLKRKQLGQVKGKVLRTAIEVDSNGKFDDYLNFFGNVIKYYRAVEIVDIGITKGGAANKLNNELGEDKRFSRKRSSKDMVEQAKDTKLSVNFTLLAYTAIKEPDEKKTGIPAMRASR